VVNECVYFQYGCALMTQS